MSIVRSILYLVYLVSAVLFIVYFFAYRPFVTELAATGPKAVHLTRYVSWDTYRHLGSVDPRSARHFKHFTKDKSPGTLRLCALGDSNTAGSEVGPESDYPSHLQRLLAQLGAGNVEVLNFGNGWYGFSQISMMWHEVASGFECDVILLIYKYFWWERDTTFNHTDLVYPYYLHARHVLSGNGVKLVEVAGNILKERFDRYFGFFPLWRYLRYDRNSPAVMRSLLPAGLEIANPFYYAADPEAEAKEIHYHLLADIADSGIPFVVMADSAEELAPLLHFKGKNVVFATAMGRSLGFPYQAPIFHHSGWGNELVAERLLQVLLAEPPTRVPQFQLENPPALDRWGETLPLNRAKAITVHLNRTPVGALVSVHDRRQYHEDRHPRVLADTVFEGLLILHAPGEPLLQACLLPIEHGLSPGDRLAVDMPGDNVVDVGPVRGVAFQLPLWVVETPGVSCGRSGALKLPLDSPKTDGAAILRVGRNVIQAHWMGGRVQLDGEMYRFRAFGEYHGEIRSIPKNGTFTLAVENPEGVSEFLLSRYSIVDTEPSVDILNHGGPKIRIKNGSAFVAPAGNG